MDNRNKGMLYEQKTIDYLLEKKVEILAKNYSCKTGEIDIIGKSGNCLLFVEVKYRMNSKFGHPYLAIDAKKRRHILNTATWYLKENNYYEPEMRFDVAIWFNGKLEYYKGAFDYNG